MDQFEWGYDRLGCVTITFQDDKEIFMQSEDDVNIFFQDIGLDPNEVHPMDSDTYRGPMVEEYYSVAQGSSKSKPPVTKPLKRVKWIRDRLGYIK